MTLKELVIKADEYDLFHILTNTEKIEFVLNAMEIGSEESMFKQLSKSKALNPDPLFSSEDLSVGGTHRLCISAYGDIITLNSDSLKVLRLFVEKIFRDGHILVRNNEITKDRDSDIYRFFKAYNIIKLDMPICEN
jgi:hypothetical protein